MRAYLMSAFTPFIVSQAAGCEIGLASLLEFLVFILEFFVSLL